MTTKTSTTTTKRPPAKAAAIRTPRRGTETRAWQETPIWDREFAARWAKLHTS